MKYLVNLIRISVGLTFIFSGFVKLVDPIGTKIKMLEYFSEDVLNLGFLNAYALEISILLILMEFVLGIWLLLGYRPKITVNLLLVLTLFFLFLTWYSAYFNKVTDCGCFGDAIKLSPWETFYKNVVLIILVLVLKKYQANIKPVISGKKIRTALAHGFGLAALLLSIYSILHLPLIDFRPYAIGKNITKGMRIPKDAPQSKFKEIWYYKINGETKEYTTDQAPWDIPGAEFISRKTIQISEGYTPPIHDFSIENDDEGDITTQVLKTNKIYLIISSNPSKINSDAIAKVKLFVSDAKQKNVKVIGLFSQIDKNMESAFDFPLYLTDETTLKTMIRSNPGIILLKKGTVAKKMSWRDLE